jgi:hypothetical protein
MVFRLSGIDGQMHLFFPIKILASFCHGSIPFQSPGNTLYKIRYVRGDTGSNHPLCHIVFGG